jgi:hypothetical protein
MSNRKSWAVNPGNQIRHNWAHAKVQRSAGHLMAVSKFSETADWSSREMKTVSSVICRWGRLEPAMVVASAHGASLPQYL